MRLNAIAILLGVSLILLLPQLPMFWVLWLLLILSGFGYRLISNPYRRILLLIIFLVSSLSYATWIAKQHLQWQLPTELENKVITVHGQIASIPELKDDHLNFIFKIDNFSDSKLAPVSVNLNWYYPPPNVIVGEYWQFAVKLRKFHGFYNPGSFDESASMLQKNLRATGYVVAPLLASSKSTSPVPNYIGGEVKNLSWHGFSTFLLVTEVALARVRGIIFQHIAIDLPNSPYAAMIQALTVGIKSGITSAQWQVMQRTGTNHLMVIAGLHIGLLSGLAFFIIKFLWRQSVRLPLVLPTPIAGAVAALIVAFIYSALAGFSIPTQRALVMLSVFLLATLWRRNLLLGLGIALAVIIVLMLDPLAIFDVGFWLSFAAVTVILYGMGARLFPSNKWMALLRLQFVVGIGLIPCTLLFFQNGALIAPLANALAIPIVGLVVVPLSLAGAVFCFIWPWLASLLWHGAAFLLQVVWWLLQHLSAILFLVWQQAIYSWWSLAAGIIGWLLLLAPRGVPNRWLGILWCLPLILVKPSAPLENNFKFTLLDVGQGLASVVQTAHHTLVFDTGAKYSPNFDLGAAVVVPFLRHEGIRKIDMLVVSHGDNDHIGGAQSVLNALPVQQIYTSVPQRFAPLVAQECLTGQQWQWDGVQFQFLYPVPSMLGLDNNSSCVLRVSTGNQHLLLTGDIEKIAEDFIVQHDARDLFAQILVAPHHGSKTSSTPSFVEAVQPREVFYPVGYLNRYHFPNESVVARYQQFGAKAYASDQCGAISVLVSPDKIGVPDCYRSSHLKWWWK